jgi:hypothetical protein
VRRHLLRSILAVILKRYSVHIFVRLGEVHVQPLPHLSCRQQMKPPVCKEAKTEPMSTTALSNFAETL